jgi:phosphatidylserine/phosphatidylglycerophosphate/cardiolipin synthase-like enzyme
MIRILQERMSAGVSVRILGKLGKRGVGLTAQRFPGKRLHVRAIIRDGQQAFVGSQGLRRLELDGRREVGVIVKDPKVVTRMTAVFEADWADTDLARQDVKDAKKDEKAEAKAEAKVEAKAEKAEAKAEEAIAEAKVEAKAEAKAEKAEAAEAKASE